MKGFFRIIGSHESLGILLFIENRRYLFNCGEGFQRFITQHKIRIGCKLDHLFLTSLAWKDIGGMPGMLLTAFDSGLGKINITGPSGLSLLWSKTTPFFNRPDRKILLKEGECVYSDELVNIESFALENCVEGSMLPSSLSYFCKAVDVKGKFHVKKADALGVKKRERSLLAKGNPVILDNGSTVHPSQVIDPPKPGSRTFILDCPSVGHLDSLVKHTRLNASLTEKNVDCVFHGTPAYLINTDQYQNWMNSTFGPETVHIFTHPTVTAKFYVFSGYESTLSLLSRYNRYLFPGLWSAPSPNPSRNPSFMFPGKKISIAQPHLHYHIEPERCIISDDWKPEEEIATIPSSLQPMHLTIDDSLLKMADKHKVSITFLGTGCAIPSKYRNVSGIHVNVDGEGVILDCGESTLNQMTHMFGLKYEDSLNCFEADVSDRTFSDPRDTNCLENVLLKLKVVCISHMHADHHLGLLELLMARFKLQNTYYNMNINMERLHLIVPVYLQRWLKSYFQIVYKDAKILEGMVDFHTIIMGEQFVFPDAKRIARISSVPVIHCSDSFGFVLETMTRFKLVYSGDTRPCLKLVKAGQGADVLIHEATFGEGMEADALEKNHSLVSEAFMVAKAMETRFLFLTHFSQRYPGADGSSKNEKELETTVLESTGLETTVLESTVLETTVLETTVLETTTIEPKAIEPKAIEPKAIEPKAIEPKAIEPKASEFIQVNETISRPPPAIPFLYAFDGMRWSSWMTPDFVHQSQELVENLVLHSAKADDQQEM